MWAPYGELACAGPTAVAFDLKISYRVGSEEVPSHSDEGKFVKKKNGKYGGSCYKYHAKP